MKRLQGNCKLFPRKKANYSSLTNLVPFTAVKSKELRYFRSVAALNLESVQAFYEREVRIKMMHNMSWQSKFHAGKTYRWQLLHFTHILNVKSLIKFSESFGVKVKLSPFVCIFL